MVDKDALRIYLLAYMNCLAMVDDLLEEDIFDITDEDGIENNLEVKFDTNNVQEQLVKELQKFLNKIKEEK